MRYTALVLAGFLIGACGHQPPVQPAQNTPGQALPKTGPARKNTPAPAPWPREAILPRVDVDPDAPVERMQRHFPNGRLMCEYDAVRDRNGNEVMHGRYTSFWGNGQVFESGQYVLGQPAGRWQYWHSSGRPMAGNARPPANGE